MFKWTEKRKYIVEDAVDVLQVGHVKPEMPSGGKGASSFDLAEEDVLSHRKDAILFT